MIAEMHRCDQHSLAGLESVNVLAHFDDLASNIAARNVRQLYPGESLAHPNVEMVHGAGADAYQHVVFAQLWIWDIFVAQNFRPAKFVNADGFHGINLTWVRGIPQETCSLGHVTFAPILDALRGRDCQFVDNGLSKRIITVRLIIVIDV